jgi:hypothetical protein
MTLFHCLQSPTIIFTKRSPQTDDAKQRRLMPLSESISLSQQDVSIGQRLKTYYNA